MKAPSSNGFSANSTEGERRTINSELWHACAGPLVSLPPVGSLVVYFPQGHSEQVAASMHKDIDGIPSYPSLPSKLICVLHNVTLHADAETDEVFAQMTLQPVNKYDKEALLASEMGLKQSKQPAEFFCKTLTASDTSTHGGFSVPRRAAEKIFPPLDFSMQPPAQELVAKDLHDVSWTFRHIYRGQPKRHLLTTGWSVFISTKRLLAGDSVLFIRDEKSQLLLGIRRANRLQPALSSSVLSSDSMHIGILAAAAHAAANNSPFTIFYNPGASPSEFVIPLAKYTKAMYTQVSLGMRFRMMFETEECGVRRYMGTITGISDLDPVRWKNSQWRNLQVGWDESTAGERRTRVSIWEIEPVATPFYICPPPFFRPKFLRQPGMPDESEVDNAFRRAMPWLGDDYGMKDSQSSIFPGLNLVQWMAMQQQNSQLLASAAQSAYFPSMAASAVQDSLANDNPSRLLNFQSNTLPLSNVQLPSKAGQQNQQVDQYQQQSPVWPQQQHQLQQPHQQQQQQQQQQNPTLLQQAQPVLPPQSLQQNSSLPQKQPDQQQLKGYQQQLVRHVVNQEVMDHKQQKQNQCSSGQLLPQTQLLNQALQPSLSQIQQQVLPKSSTQLQQSPSLANLCPIQPSSIPQVLHFQQSIEPQHALLKQQQQQQKMQEIELCQPQLQLQLLQKLQQQRVLSELNSSLQPQLSQQQLAHQENHQQQSTAQFVPSLSKQPQQIHANHITGHLKPQQLVRAHSTVTESDVPLCSPSPSSNCLVSSSNLLSKNQETMVPPIDNLFQELQSKPDARVKNEMHCTREVDQLDASSASSFCLDGGQEHFSLPPLCMDGDVQLDARNNLVIGANADGFMPNTLLPRGSGSGKGTQNVLAAYGTQKDVDTEVSTAAISSQSFGVPDVSFKPGCSSDAVANDSNGLLNRGMWANQPQRLRTYTKVQKRGSVGRSIDVTRYKGYDELKHDLACMFGIEGQLEDPHKTEWKLVYVDHENDILLVGDDPWEEFVSCVQSIKILSAAEVQQMSLDSDLAGIAVQNQVCSGPDNGNVWKGHYDDYSAASFHR